MKQSLLLLSLLFSCSEHDPEKVSVQKTDEKQIVQPIQSPDKRPELTIHESQYRILPVDQSGEDKSLQVFVEKLKKIIRQKDLDGLINCLDTGIVVSWGGGEYGIDVFRKNNGLNFEPKKAEIWKTLDRFIAMGGAWDDPEKTRFCFPYVQSNLLIGSLNIDLDCYFYVTCIDPKVLVYENPDTGSKKTGMLSYEVLTALNASTEFTKIQSIDQTVSGYVLTNQLFRCYYAHPTLEKINGEWKIVSFAPYD